MAQAVGIVGVLIAGDDLIEALPQQRQRVVLHALLLTWVAEQRGPIAGQLMTLIEGSRLPVGGAYLCFAKNSTDTKRRAGVGVDGVPQLRLDAGYVTGSLNLRLVRHAQVNLKTGNGHKILPGRALLPA